MLRSRPFEWKRPHSVDEVVSLLVAHGDKAQICSGGSDLIPNIKLWQIDVEVMISLRKLPNNTDIVLKEDTIYIGGMVSLYKVSQDPLIAEHIPVLADTVNRIASPQIRRQGTLVGNLLIKSRCRYINQSELFRQALGGCLRSHGKECHVVPGGEKCVAAMSSDSVPILIALGASVRIAGPNSQRTLPISELYQPDGCSHLMIEQNEFILGIEIPIPKKSSRFSYRKWAARKSIDFPLVSVALRLDLSEAGSLEDGVAVIGVLGPKPRMISLAQFHGREIDLGLATEIGALVQTKSKTLPNVPYDPEYRRIRLGVEAKRAVMDIKSNY